MALLTGLFLLGALASASLLVALFWLSVPLFPGESGWFLIGLAHFGYPVAMLICIVAGVLFAGRYRNSPHKKKLALSGYLSTLIAIAFAAWLHREEQQHLDAVQEHELIRETNELREWREKYETRYPRNAESLPAVLGPLLYPDCGLAAWKTSINPYEEPKWLIELSTEDRIDEVLAYYMSVLPEGLDQMISRFPLQPLEPVPPQLPYVYQSDCQLTPDGRCIVLEICVTPSGFRVMLVTFASYSRGQPELIKAWDSNLQDYQDAVARIQEPARMKLQKRLKGLVYPSSTVTWAKLGGANALLNSLFQTRDSFEDVSRFYRAKLRDPAEGTVQLQWNTRTNENNENTYVTVFQFGDAVYIQFSSSAVILSGRKP